MFERCHNPVCKKELKPGSRKPGTPRRFCSDGCKTDGWALKRAGELLSSLSAERKLEVLVGLLSPNGNHRKITVRKKTYQCPKWPYLSIGRLVKFHNGYFVTENAEAQKVIERSSDFGVHIREVQGQQT